MRLPKHVKIGPYKFEVTTRDETWSAITGVSGRFNSHELVIDIVLSESPVYTLDTLLHEILHAAVFTYNIPMGDEECMVRPLATALTQVMVDNPDVVKYLVYVARKNGT